MGGEGCPSGELHQAAAPISLTHADKHRGVQALHGLEDHSLLEQLLLCA